jgi:hypothetical protein
MPLVRALSAVLLTNCALAVGWALSDRKHKHDKMESKSLAIIVSMLFRMRFNRALNIMKNDVIVELKYCMDMPSGIT